MSPVRGISSRYFSWTSGDPHRSGFKLHIAVIIIVIIIIIIIIIIRVYIHIFKLVRQSGNALSPYDGEKIWTPAQWSLPFKVETDYSQFLKLKYPNRIFLQR